MNIIHSILKSPSRCLLALACLLLLLPASRAERWDWKSMNNDEQAFCDQHMPRILEIHKTQGTEAALAAIEKTYQLAERTFRNPYFFNRAVWYEAQVKGGKEDEEWGLAAFQYLWDRDLKTHPEYAIRLPSNQYCLLDNIIEKNAELGRMAQARAVRLQSENYLTTQKGLDTSGTSYTDMGPIYSFLPEARKRDFPIYEHELPMRYRDPTTETKKDFIEYPNIYVLGGIADMAQNSGDWIKAAELSIWCARYADKYVPGKNHMHSEVDRILAFGSAARLADIALLHGYPQEARHFLEEYVENSAGKYNSWKCILYRAKLELAVTKIKTGGLVEEDMVMADEAVELIIEDPYYGRSTNIGSILNKARIYHALGHKQEAWSMVDNLMAEAETDVNPYHWVRMLTTAIDLALDDGAIRPELEKWLVLALDNARQAGNKFEELPLYEKYAHFLMMKGRYAEAVQIQQEAVRLAKAMSLPKRLQENLDKLADMQRQISDRQLAMDSKPQQEENQPQTAPAENSPAEDRSTPRHGGLSASTPSVDIQPRSSLSAALPGRPAYGRFYLHNPAAVSQQGTLQLTGAIDQPEWRNQQWFTVSASPMFESVQLEKTLNLEPGASCIIDILGLPLENGDDAEVSCQWVPTGQEQAGATGTWKYESADNGKRTAVIDAHELLDNPFYLIPIHHMLQRIDSDTEETIDFTVEASAPMRIEAYDALSGELLAIDANGDGDFMDRGDQIVGDGNRNSWPDLVFGKSQQLASLVMYVKPTQAMTNDVELTVSIRVNDEWQVDSIDVIKPAAP